MIVIIDYGMGNLKSVAKALESLGAEVRVSSEAADLARAEKLILPGVGAFPAAMRELSARGLVDPIKGAIESGRPYLGICLGLQLLFDRSEEGQGAQGLGVLAGSVKRFRFEASAAETPPLKIPHMGWNQVTSEQSTVDRGQRSEPERKDCPLLKGIPAGSYFYFVHSYYAAPEDQSLVALEADYGGAFAAMVWRGNLFATQFHPEKSQAVGLQLLRNFINL